MDENKNKQESATFASLETLAARWKDGTFREIIDDWKWIFTYSARYKFAIVFYVFLGIFSTTMGLVSSVASKYLIDIITGYQTSKLAVLILIMVGSAVVSLALDSVLSRITTRLSIYINNDIQADIFDKIVDADWLSLSRYSNGDVLNRFNSDISTVSGNAISWLPSIIIAVYRFAATFLVILHYDWVMALIALGNRPDLFAGNPNASTREDYLDYDVPPEALEDEVFAAMLKEAEKYLGYPYVWGGSNPSTSFDCSGFVSWVINHSGWDVGRLGAQGLCDICTPVSSANARPGDLIFFKGTYDTPGVSHVGIYVGDGMMIHCGNPISYASINTSYWQQHFYTFGRLP